MAFGGGAWFRIAEWGCHLAIPDFQQRVAEMTDAEISSILINKDAWQLEFYQCAVVEAEKRNIGIGRGPEEIIRKQSQDILAIVLKSLRNAEGLTEIKRKLVSSGVPEEAAVGAINELAPSVSKEQSGYWQRRLMWNLLFLSLGIGVTVVSYLIAAPGGTYILAWGAMVFGGIKAVIAHRKVKHWDQVMAETNSSYLENAK